MRKKMLLSVCAFAMAILSSFAQTSTVTGKVIDDKGAPVVGATVIEKGTKNGVSAGLDGAFSLKVKSGATLVISALGFENKQIAATSSNLMVQLITDVRSLSEVVVTGVGAATSKKKLGVDVASVDISKEVKVPTGDVGQQLVGQVAGAQISSTNGSPGAKLNILLRGINTIQGGTFPMILMDGLEVRATDLNSIDVNIIERVEVVQGAAAASLYGAQGANGVIQLFTKNAKSGKLNVDVSSSATTNSLLNIGNVHKSQYHAFVTDASNNVIQANGTPLVFDPALERL